MTGRAVRDGTGDAAPAALLELIGASGASQAVCVAAELRIADLLADGARAVDDLAQAAKCEPTSLHRLLRALASLRLCVEPERGRFELTPLGALLRSDARPGLSRWAIWWGKHQWATWGELLCSVRTGGSARA